MAITAAELARLRARDIWANYPDLSLPEGWDAYWFFGVGQPGEYNPLECFEGWNALKWHVTEHLPAGTVVAIGIQEYYGNSVPASFPHFENGIDSKGHVYSNVIGVNAQWAGFWVGELDSDLDVGDWIKVPYYLFSSVQVLKLTGVTKSAIARRAASASSPNYPPGSSGIRDAQITSISVPTATVDLPECLALVISTYLTVYELPPVAPEVITHFNGRPVVTPDPAELWSDLNGPVDGWNEGEFELPGTFEELVVFYRVLAGTNTLGFNATIDCPTNFSEPRGATQLEAHLVFLEPADDEGEPDPDPPGDGVGEDSGDGDGDPPGGGGGVSTDDDGDGGDPDDGLGEDEDGDCGQSAGIGTEEEVG